MKLITKALEAKIPMLRATEGEKDPMVQVKIFTPDTNWTWYIIEWDGEDLCWGWVDGHFPEIGYFSLEELRGLRGPLGLPVERDMHFSPRPLSQVK